MKKAFLAVLLLISFLNFGQSLADLTEAPPCELTHSCPVKENDGSGDAIITEEDGLVKFFVY
jgi:hypothetical protein